MEMNFSRRGILAGLTSLLAAPTIVRAGVLMPVRSIIMPPLPPAPLPVARYMVEMMGKDGPMVDMTSMGSMPLLDRILRVTNTASLEVKTVRYGDWYPNNDWSIYPTWPQWVDSR